MEFDCCVPRDKMAVSSGMEHQQNTVCENYEDKRNEILAINIDEYDYPFENIVFEGGGNKGLAYSGALRVLEEIGVIKNTKRFAGTSAGAMIAVLVAVGYNSDKMEQFLRQDLSKLFLDHSYGYLSLLPNLLYGYGWNPGNRIFNWYGELLEEKTGNPDVTFIEVYNKFGKELCVVVTNLNMMTTEYFHPKTTPDVPVRVAVRMSMSFPGLFQATTYGLHGVNDIYVDGGVLCNYPIKCYDGWWLSMEKEDSFLNRLQPLENLPMLFENKERFGTYNEKTLGFLLYADNEREVLRDSLEKRIGAELPDPLPDTKLAKEMLQRKKLRDKAKHEYSLNLRAVSAFFKVLNKHNRAKDDNINKTELKEALNDTKEFPKHYVERLFGRNVTVDEAMDALDEDQDGKVTYQELVHLIERNGVSLQALYHGYQRKKITGLVSFLDTLQSSLLFNVMRINVEERDIARTVGINTGHVGTTDFNLEDADKDFTVEQGRRATESFFRHYVFKKKPPKKVTSEKY